MCAELIKTGPSCTGTELRRGGGVEAVAAMEQEEELYYQPFPYYQGGLGEGALGGEVDRYKLERKRERNRVAATKCRMRKMERIAQLDRQVQSLQEEQHRLGQESHQLRQQVGKEARRG